MYVTTCPKLKAISTLSWIEKTCLYVSYKYVFMKHKQTVQLTEPFTYTNRITVNGFLLSDEKCNRTC